MIDENEIESVDTESGVTEGSSTEAPSVESNSGESAKAASLKPESEPTPFHEHPRFKELVEQKNEFSKRYQDMESRYKSLEQQFGSLKESQPKAATETDQLIADLKKVDPRLANVIESQLKAAKTAESVQARLEAFEKQSQESQQRQQIDTAVSKINQMHESNKASPEVRQFINDKMDLLYMQGKLNLQNLESTYKDQHSAIKKYEDALARSVRESYVTAKTKDAAVPASVPKGPQAKAPQKPLNAPRDKEALKSAVVKSFLKEQAANRDATNN